MDPEICYDFLRLHYLMPPVVHHVLVSHRHVRRLKTVHLRSLRARIEITVGCFVVPAITNVEIVLCKIGTVVDYYEKSGISRSPFLRDKRGCILIDFRSIDVICTHV